MLKYIGVLSVAFSSVGFGVVGYDRTKRRERELQDFRRVLVYLRDSLECLQCGLDEAFSGGAKHCETEFKQVLDEFLALLNKENGIRASEAWMQGLESAVLSLNEEDKAVLSDFGRGLDGHSFEAQKRNILLALSETEGRLKDAAEQRMKNGKLSLKLGVFCGIGAILLLM